MTTDSKTILIVDDSSIMRRLVREIVEADPIFRVVDVAENGKIALQKVREHKPDAVLLDIEMPELSGLDTMRRLGLRSSSKIIILSSLGYEGSKERAEALRLGAADVIDKPSGSVSMDIKAARASVINQTLRRVLGLPPAPEAADAAPSAALEETVSTPPTQPAGGSAAGSAPLAMALDTVRQAVLAFGIDGRLFYANAVAPRLLGDDGIAAGRSTLDQVFDGLNEFIVDDIRAVLADGAAKAALPVDYALPSGDWLPCLFTIVPVPDPNGRGNGVLVLIEDKSVEHSLRKVLDQTMSSSVTDAIIAGDSLGLDGKEADATMLFCDIRSFTTLCENMSAGSLVAMLNEYFTFMADVIRGNNGIIDKYIGDAIMALFGVPSANPRQADDAVAAAIAMIQALELFNGDRAKAGEASFQIGIGIASGMVIAGTLGSPERKNYTVIGDAVNLASRIEGLTKLYGAEILVCGRTRAAMTGRVPTRLVDVVKVKGQDTATELHQILNRAILGAALDTHLSSFAAALAAYQEGRFQAAGEAFDAIARHIPDDATSAMLAARCRDLAAAPPANWQGIWKLDSK
ncbi:MAG: adenylate [Rhodospirillaceae bacterium]|nr:MAG: adenylate [Rhodospirillaceae bacterium]TNC95403.1 MAG: adenylate cyclase [Stygiobacter sp.]